jgi:hypothetical protein
MGRAETERERPFLLGGRDRYHLNSENLANLNCSRFLDHRPLQSSQQSPDREHEEVWA